MSLSFLQVRECYPFPCSFWRSLQKCFSTVVHGFCHDFRCWCETFYSSAEQFQLRNTGLSTLCGPSCSLNVFIFNVWTGLQWRKEEDLQCTHSDFRKSVRIVECNHLQAEVIFKTIEVPGLKYVWKLQMMNCVSCFPGPHAWWALLTLWWRQSILFLFSVFLIITSLIYSWVIF